MKRLLRIRWIETVVVCCLRPIQTWPIVALLWKRVKWAISEECAGRDEGLRWVKLPSGTGLYVHPGELLGTIYFTPDSYEPVTTQFILSHLKPGDVFVDIGANYGYFTMLAAGVVGRHGQVMAFEANPVLLGIIGKSVEKNGIDDHVQVIGGALSDSYQEAVPFYVTVDPRQMGISSLCPWTAHLTAGNLNEQKTIMVKTERFDDVIKRRAISRIDMVKIDVEGAEKEVVRGMLESLNRFAPRHLIVETGLRGDVAAVLASLGYKATALELHSQEHEWGNILFQRKGGE